MKRLLPFSVLFLSLTFSNHFEVRAQSGEAELRGKVLDEAGSPLVGASVLLAGTHRGVQTDAAGKFVIPVPADGRQHKLYVSYVGFAVQEVSAQPEEPVEVHLNRLNTDDEIVIGYQRVERRDLTGAVSTVNARQLKDIPDNSAADALAGRLAGVGITADDGQPGANYTIKVRGGGSITQDNSPLYIIDGVQVENGLSYIAPQDIESIDVLKDASSTAIYGARGANGVVIITTKGGRNTNGKISVNYNGFVGFSELPRELGVMDPFNFAEYQWERDRYLSPADSAVINMYAPVWDSVLSYQHKKPVDWQHLVFGRHAFQQTHNVSMSGGTAATQYALSLTDNEQEGIMITSSFDRKVANFRLDQTLSARVKAGFNIRYVTQEADGSGTTDGENTSSGNVQSFSNLRQSIRYTPYIFGNNPYTYNGAYDIGGADISEGNSLTLINPILLSNAEFRRNITNVVDAGGFVNVNFFPFLSFRSQVGFDQNVLRQDAFDDTITVNSKLNGAGQGIGSITTTQLTTLNNSNVFTYTNAGNQTDFSRKNQIMALVGQEVYLEDTKNYSITTKYFPVGISAQEALANMNLTSPPVGAVEPLPTSSEVPSNIASFFSRVGYTLNGKYMATASYRTDGTSKFSSQRRWGSFPSVSAAWRLSDERFLQGVKWLNDLKLRASYGTAGNNRIPDFLYLTQYVTATGTPPNTTPVGYGLDNTLYTGFAPATLGNNLLQWEVTHSKNIGVDAGLFGNRIQSVTDVYFDNTDKLLIDNPSLPTSSGYNNQYQNIGSTSNKGVEEQLTAAVVRRKSFNWTATFNISFNKNVVTSLGGVPPIPIASGALGTSNSDYLLQKGQPVGSMYGYVSDGFYKVSDFTYNPATSTYTLNPGVPNDVGITGVAPTPGAMKLMGLGKDSAITANDRTVIGNAQPKFFGGLNQQFTFGNFDASIFINFQYGDKIFDANRIEFSSGYTPGSNLLKEFDNRWRNVDNTGTLITDPTQLAALNKNATIWEPSVTSSTNAFFPVSWAVEDGSFVRINNISVGYSIPDRVLHRARIGRLRVYVTGNNLYVFTHYSGYDPDVNTRRATPATPGVDYSAFPRGRTFLFGVNMSL